MKIKDIAPADDALVGSLEGYADFLADIKGRIQTAQVKAALAVSRELLRLYWEIGREIVTRQQAQGWGQAVIARLAADLQQAFPGVSGFSPRNIKYMRAFAEANPDPEIVQQLLHNSPLPWGITRGFWTKRKTPTSAFGIFRPRTRTDGAARFWRCRSKAACMSGRARRRRF